MAVAKELATPRCYYLIASDNLIANQLSEFEGRVARRAFPRRFPAFGRLDARSNSIASTRRALFRRLTVHYYSLIERERAARVSIARDVIRPKRRAIEFEQANISDIYIYIFFFPTLIAYTARNVKAKGGFERLRANHLHFVKSCATRAEPFVRRASATLRASACLLTHPVRVTSRRDLCTPTTLRPTWRMSSRAIKGPVGKRLTTICPEHVSERPPRQ